MKKQFPTTLLIAALAAAPAWGTFATELTWDGSTGSNDWDALDGGTGGSDTNWSGGSGAEIADFDNSLLFSDVANVFSRTIDLNGDREALSMTFNSATLADGQSSLNYILGTSSTAEFLRLLDGDLTVLDGNVLINNTIFASGTWDIADGSTVTMVGSLLGSGDLTKSGAGTLRVNNRLTASTLRVDGGLFVVDSGSATISRLAGSGTIQVSGGTLGTQFGGSIGALEVESLATLSMAGSLSTNLLSGDGNITTQNSGSTLTVGGSNGSSTFAGTIEGNGSLTKAGFGVLTLSGTNTYTGPTTVNGGILVLEGSNAINDAGAVIVNDRLQIVTDETIGSLSGLGQVALNTGGLTIDDSSDRTFGGFFVGSNDLTLSGSGALTLTGFSSSTGTFNVNGTSTLRLANAAGLTLDDTADVALGDNGTLALDVDESIGRLTGTGTVDLGSNTLTITEGGSYGGIITGTGDLTLSGSEVFTLTGASTSTGTFNIDGTSTLHLSNQFSQAIADTANVVVGANGTLDVFNNETIGGLAHHGSLSILSGATLTVDGDYTGTGGFTGLVIADLTNRGGELEVLGSFSPGNSPAAVNFLGDFTLGSNSTALIELGGTTQGTQYDFVNVLNTLSLDGTLDVVLINGFTPSDGDQFDLFDFGSLEETFAQFNLPTLDQGLQWDTADLYTDGVIRVVPEPTSLALLVIGGLLIGRRGREVGTRIAAAKTHWTA